MQTGEILGASLEQIQLEIGIGSAVTASSVALYGHLTTYGWWTNLWEFVSDKNILLCQEDPIIPPLQHEDDQYVMERIISHTPRSKADIRIFNQCQIKMQVVMMADIIHADGIMLMDQMTSYSPDTVNMSKYDWPCKEPTHQDWNIWQKGLQIITSENETLPYDEKLGAWIDEPHKHWEWSYSPLLHTLYQSNDELWYAQFLDNVNYT
jgi:hypothetical protein